MKLSIVIPVLNSHEIVRRQSLYYKKMRLPKDVELILVDDGSSPPLESSVAKVITTNDYRSWTQPKARNIGASEAKGEFILFTDIDHIVTREAIDQARTGRYDYGRFRREFGVLMKDGDVSQRYGVLMGYGVPGPRLQSRGLKISCHTLSMFIRRSVFEDIGGFRENLTKYPTHDDGHMKRALKKLEKEGSIVKCPDQVGRDERARILMIPNGRFCGDKNFNPFGLFHEAKR